MERRRTPRPPPACLPPESDSFAGSPELAALRDALRDILREEGRVELDLAPATGGYVPALPRRARA
jgi:hypothetical protein